MSWKAFLLTGLAAFALADLSTITQVSTATAPVETVTATPSDSSSDTYDYGYGASGYPTLNPIASSYYMSAYLQDASYLSTACNPTSIPNYLSTAPASIQSAISSFELAVETWLSAQGSGSGMGPSYVTPTGSCAVAAVASNTAMTTSSVSSEATGVKSSSTLMATKSGSGTGSTSSASGTATGTAAKSTTSSSAAVAMRGELAWSFVGVFGVLSLIAGL